MPRMWDFDHKFNEDGLHLLIHTDYILLLEWLARKLDRTQNI